MLGWRTPLSRDRSCVLFSSIRAARRRLVMRYVDGYYCYSDLHLESGSGQH